MGTFGKSIVMTATAMTLGLLGADLHGQHSSLSMKNLLLNGPDMEEIGCLRHPETKNRRWSVGCETLDRDYAIFDEYKDFVGELGVGYARIQSGWAKCEQKKGKYDFAWLDEIVDGLCERGVRPWMCLCYGNPIYGAQKNLGSVIFNDEETMRAWKKYVGTVVDRYKGKVAMYEIWNEPNLGENSKAPERYANLLINTIGVIRDEDKDAKIIGFGLSRMPVSYTKSVYEILKAKGMQDSLDYLSFHPYHENPDDATEEIVRLKSLVESYTDKTRLFQGECGCPSILEWGHALRYYEWTEYSQVKWVLRRLANDFALDIPSSIFTMVDLQYPNMLQSFGLVRMNLLKKPVYKRPSFYGVRNMATLLTEDTFPDGELECTSTGTRSDIRTVAVKDKSGRRTGAMLWLDGKIPGSSLERELTDLTIHGLDLRKPVYVDPVTGKVYRITMRKGGSTDGRLKLYGIPVWDCPVFIMEQESVPMHVYETEYRGSGSTNDMLY